MKRAALLAAVLLLGLGAAPRPEADLIIRGGTVYPGTGEPFVGDVAVKGDRILQIGARLTHSAARTIHARGLVIAPGFIDPHAHIADQLASGDARVRLIPAFLMQGVTTAFIGNDGAGDPDIAAVLGRAAERPVGINYAAYAGFDPIRRKVIGEADRSPTAGELRRMRGLVAQAMCDGALGLSTGLFYPPQSFAMTREVVALAREAGLRGGIYDSHIRDESSYSIGLVAAIDEAIQVGRQAGLPVHIAHIKALGVDVAGQAPAIIARIEAAQRAGVRVTADQYPWSASGTTLAAALIPAWAQDGGREALLRRLADPSLARRLRSEMAENLRRRGGAPTLLITTGQHKGRTLAEVTKARRQDAVGAAIAIVKVADPSVASFNQTEADIAAFMRRPWVMTGSDASPGHPRAFGSFARKYAEYVVAKPVLTMREFVERSSTLAADTFGLEERGRLKPGAFADLVVFDPKAYAPRATYEQPTLLARGVRTVVVNGRLAVDEGRLTGLASGRALPRKPRLGKNADCAQGGRR